MKLGSKGSTLEKVKLKKSKIPQTYIFKADDFKKNKEYYYSVIAKKFKDKIAVRSSNFFEDKSNKTLAGKFYSTLNIDSNSSQSVINSIDKTIKSYSNYKHKKNEILIQDMVKNVKYSGVIFTQDTKNNSPYFKIDYTKSNDTTLVTSGLINPETFIYFRHSKIKPKEKFLSKLIKSTEEIIKIFKINNLDIEFAIDNNNQVFIIQIRELKTDKTKLLFNTTSDLKKLEKN